jgi:hypothetical protein
MRTYIWVGVMLVCGALPPAAWGSDSVPKRGEGSVAEALGAMRCRVKLKVENARVMVDRVDAGGRIAADRMKTEPLSEGLFALLRELGQLRSLRLDVKGGETDRTSLRALPDLRSLRELQLFGQDVTDETMPYVCSLTNLESLTLWDVSLGEQGLARLSALRMLKRLELSDFKTLNREGVERIAHLSNLEYLRLYGQFEEAALRPLSALPKLETVWISGSQVNVLLADLEGVSTIQRIEIARADVDATTVAHLLRMKNLRSLKLECCAITPEAVKSLHSFHLGELECVGIASEALSELAKGMTKCQGDLHVWY